MRNSKIALLFPGQGAQRPGMGRDIYEQCAASRLVFEQASDVLGRDICVLAFDGPKEVLDLTTNTQPCLLTIEVAILAALLDAGIEPHSLAGFSLGEWAAIVAAGCIPFDKALRLVSLRAQAMQKAVPVGAGAMAVIIGQSVETVQELCERVEGYVVPSNYNCPGQTTVAGEAAAVNTLMKLCEADGIAAQKLAVSIPSHCKLMAPAAQSLAHAMEHITLLPPKFHLIMNATGKATMNADAVKANLLKQLVSPVQFQLTLANMLDNDIDCFIEVGPGKTLSDFVKRMAKAVGQAVNIRRVEDTAGLASICTVLQEEAGRNE